MDSGYMRLELWEGWADDRNVLVINIYVYVYTYAHERWTCVNAQIEDVRGKELTEDMKKGDEEEP